MDTRRGRMETAISDHVRIDPLYRAALEACDLHTVDGALRRVEGRVVAWSRTTDTLHVPGTDDAPGFFLKRFFYPHWGKRLRGALRGTLLGPHRALIEYRLLQAMRNLGIPAVRPVACGARRSFEFVSACYLVTEEVPHARNLTSFAQDVHAGRVNLSLPCRRELLRCLARLVADMHAAGFSHGQMFWRNILVRNEPIGDPEFFLLDARPRHGRRYVGRRTNWWLDELAHLAASARQFTTRTQRLRFLQQYLGEARSPLEVRQIARRVERMAQRWRRHEGHRIHMNRLFEEWARQLERERVMANETVAASHA